MFRKYIIFSLLIKSLCGCMKWPRRPDEMASRAGFGPRAIVWRPLSYVKTSCTLCLQKIYFTKMFLGESCCNGQPYVKINDSRNKRHTICCTNGPYGPFKNPKCCGGEGYDVEGGTLCCGDKVYGKYR